MYKKRVRTIGWIYWFKNNTIFFLKKRNCNLTLEEYVFSENKLLSLAQSELYSGVTDDKLNTLLPLKDGEGLIRVKTTVSNKEDTNNCCYHLVLASSKHPVVFKLGMDMHKDNCW